VLTEVLDETKAGIHALSKQHLRESLVRMYGEFRHYGHVRYHAETHALEQYSHRQMARRFAAVLDEVIDYQKSQAAAYSSLSGRVTDGPRRPRRSR